MNDDDKNGYDHTELTAEERSALDALAREAVPPATLEDRVVAALASRGSWLPDGSGGSLWRRSPLPC